MGKIFEAIQRGGENQPAEMMAALLDQDTVGTLQPAPAQKNGADPVSQPRASSSAEPMAQPAQTEKSTANAIDLERVRMLPVRLQSNSPLLPFDASRAAAEEYRIIRTKLRQHPLQPRTIVVSSAGPGDGKSLTAVNLAATMALKSDAQILLMDVDFRRGALDEMLDLPAEPGLADVLEGRATLEEALVQVEQLPAFYFLPRGNAKSHGAELLDSDIWRHTCKILRKQFHYVFFDSPPVGAVADYQLLESASDGVLFVVRPNHTRRDSCYSGMQAVSQGKLLGVVMNCAEEWFLSRGSSSYDYYR